MQSDEETQREFRAAYPRLFPSACTVIERFFRFDTGPVEDAVAETMARSFMRWERVREQYDSTAWVIACAKDVCLERLRATALGRKPGRRVPLDPEAAARHEREVVISTDLWKTLETLTRRQRDVAVLCFLMDCDEPLAGRALNMSIADVRTAARTARYRLRARLGESYPNEAVG